MARDRLDELEMPAAESPEQDEMLDIDADIEMADEEPEAEEPSPLADLSDDELMQELEARGYDTTALAGAEDGAAADEEMDIDELEFEDEEDAEE